MVNLNLTVEEFRERIYIDEEELLQNFISNILIMGGVEKSNRAYYTIVYHLLGKRTFPSRLKEKIMYYMNQGIIEKTFLDRNNYEQRVYGMLSEKNSITGEFSDIYYKDLLVNLGNGNQAVRNGRGLSPKRQYFLQKGICTYSISQAIDEIVKQFSDKNLNSRFSEMHNAREKVLLLSTYYLVEDLVEGIVESEEEKEEQKIKDNVTLSETEKTTLILARRGQGKFRADVIERNKCCPFTGVTDSRFLIASHIKPWKESDNKQKLDADNGFAFTPTYDRLFDQGYISFDDDKKLLVSSSLNKACIEAFKLEEGKIVEKLVLSDSCKEYLKFHRENKFKR